MNIIVESLAKKQLYNIFYYNSQYSLKNAFNIEYSITENIKNLEFFPYLGRNIPEISDKHFREIIYYKNKRNGYRIMYYIHNYTSTIRVFNIISCKQDFNSILATYDYFKKF